MNGKRYYEAKKYAHSLNYSHRLYQDYNKALIQNVWSRPISKDKFMAIARDAKLDLDVPDAISEHPHPIKWWNVDLPDYVLIAKDGEQDNYWAFTALDDRMMQNLEEAFAESDARGNEDSIQSRF
jgi:hypothetical protein